MSARKEKDKQVIQEFILVLRAARIAKGLTQAQVAHAIKVGVYTIYGWENSVTRKQNNVPRYRKHLVDWARYLGVPVPSIVLHQYEGQLCGTAWGARRHRNRREEPCKACLRAAADYIAEWRARKAESSK